MITHILIATDFSPPSMAAVDYGCDLAVQLGGRVTLLNVFSSGIVALPDAVYAPTEEELRMLEHAAKSQLLAVAYQATRAGLRIHCVAVEGVAAETIPEYARSHAVDLIVMGTHGRRGLSHALLGSVAEQVLRRAPCPVLTIGSKHASAAHAVAL
jgi:nucleotide-binding universal stress UspA family protein